MIVTLSFYLISTPNRTEHASKMPVFCHATNLHTFERLTSLSRINMVHDKVTISDCNDYTQVNMGCFRDFQV